MQHSNATSRLDPARAPKHELQRLAELAEYAALDTPPERDFDALVRRVAQVCGVPIALIGLVDADREWFKARIGLELRETPRSASLGAHAMLAEDILEVPDLAVDPRFADNPQVQGATGIRFYAGVPLRSPEGYPLGVVCAIDRVPRRLSGAQRDALRQVGREAMAQLERRRQLRVPSVERILETADHGARSAALEEMPVAGSRFGRYTILGEIGRGAMATVYAAYDDQLDRKIAIKLIRDPDRRVQREAQAAARISDPNVVQIYEIGAFAGHDFIAMELIDGITLTTWQRIRRRHPHDIIAMYVQAGRGLAAAHAAGLVHRDFKPDNVLIDNSGRARVGDFGLAYSGASEPELEDTCPSLAPCNTATRDDVIVGTPAYMAPEQLRSPEVDARADQFSLCAALHEAVYGVRPFRGTSVAELRRNALAGVLQEPAPGHEAPPGLRGLLRRGLAAKPADRWPSLVGLLDELDRLGAQREVEATGPQRRRMVLALLLGAFSVLGVELALARVGPAGVTVPQMLGQAAVVLVVVGVSAYRGRATLLRVRYHRRMLTLVLAVIVGGHVVIPLVGAGGGLAIDDILMIQMLTVGQVFVLAAALVAPMLLLNCAVAWGGALAVAFGAPALLASALSAGLGIVVFAVIWSRAPLGRRGESWVARGG